MSDERARIRVREEKEVAADAKPSPVTDSGESTADAAQEPRPYAWSDLVDAASDDSFPASDPPPWTLGIRDDR